MAAVGALPRNAKSLLARAGHFYFIRIILIGMVLGIVLVTTRYTGFTLVNVFLLLFGAGKWCAGPVAEMLSAAVLTRLYRHPVIAVDTPAGVAYLPR